MKLRPTKNQERRTELSRQERRLDQKEEAMDRKTAVWSRKKLTLPSAPSLWRPALDEIEQIKARELTRWKPSPADGGGRKAAAAQRLDSSSPRKGNAHRRVRDADQGRVRHNGPRAHQPGRGALCRRPFQRSHGIRGAAAQ